MNNKINDHKNKWAKDRESKLAKQPGHTAPAPEPKAIVAAVAEAVGEDKKLVVEQTVLGETIKVDVQSLKTAFPDHPERNKATPPYLDKYREYCAEALERGDVETADPVLLQCAVWAINVEDWTFAKSLIDHCKGMTFDMKRSLPELMADMVLQADKPDQDAHLAVVEKVDTGEWEVNHPLAAKLYKWAAKHFEELDLDEAVRFAVKAHSTYPNVGVKTFMETLQKRQKEA